MTTGDRIKARRKELNLRAEQLAVACNVSAATIYKYEKGDIERLGIDKLTPLAKVLRTTEAWLLNGEEQPSVNNDPELTEYLEELRDNPEMRMLFSVTKGATKKDLEAAVAIIQALRAQSGN